MPFPLVLPVAALAGLGVITYVVTRKKTDPEAEPVPGGGKIGPQSATGAPVMSAQMRQAFLALMSGSDPDAMETTAGALEPFGFLTEAGQLRAQAAALRNARTSGVQSLAPIQASAPAQRTAQPTPSFVPATIPVPGFTPAAAPAPTPVAVLPAPASLPSFARVTTSDAAPRGDLMVRPAPNAAGTPGVGAEKDGIVTVIKKDVLGDGVWSQIVWGGGPRLGPVSGFVKTEFLRPSAVGPMGTAIAGESDGQVRCVAPSGCRLRKSPSSVADFRAIVGNGEVVKVLKIVRGPKLESFSPGQGGWAHVQYKSLQGWVPLEWLSK